MVERETLYDLREMVKSLVGGKGILVRAEAWAREQSKEWPYGIYSPNDFPTMYEAGFLRGYLAGGAAAASEPCESECHPQPGKGDTYSTVDGKRWCSSCHAEQSHEDSNGK